MTSNSTEKPSGNKMTRAEAGRKGGLAVSTNREHMAEIGRKGGTAVSRNREHMASIGKKGGEARRNASRANDA